jgi:uncharacterized protein with NRDE domain
VCLILAAWEADPTYQLVVAANRDEFFERESLPMHWWADVPVLAGRDLTAGGSWMTISESGRFAAVTNVRDFTRPDAALRSRGEIPVGFSAGSDSPADYCRGLPTEEFTGYNALVSDLETLWWTSNWAGAALPLDAGIYGVSNAALDTPWPKVVNGKRHFGDALASGAEVEDFFSVLADDAVAPDDLLPDTGLDIELERLASPAFISSPDYGTTASTVLRIRRDGFYDVEERRFLRGEETGRVAFTGDLTRV